MVANMIRLLRARMALLAVDEAGMSTVEYSIVIDYNRPPPRPLPGILIRGLAGVSGLRS